MAPEGVEIERKFLVADDPPGLKTFPSSQLRQGYLAVDSDAEVRLRDDGHVRTLTVKSGSGLERGEVEVELSAEQFEALWPATVGKRLMKHRFELPAGKWIHQLDVYAGPLEGLKVVEVEFPSAADATGFEPPDWFGREVTNDARYKNASLALQGLPKKEGASA